MGECLGNSELTVVLLSALLLSMAAHTAFSSSLGLNYLYPNLSTVDVGMNQVIVAGASNGNTPYTFNFLVYNSVGSLVYNSLFAGYAGNAIVSNSLRGSTVIQEPHAILQLNNEFYIGTWTGEIITITNPDNRFPNFSNEQLPNIEDIAEATYDPVIKRIFFNAYNETSGKGGIISVSASNILNWSWVYNGVQVSLGTLPSITNDGNYIYGVTYTTPAQFVKFHILSANSVSLFANAIWTGSSDGHAVALGCGSGSGGEYVCPNPSSFYASTAVAGYPLFASVNTLTLSYNSINFGSASDGDYATNLMSCTQGYCYLGIEDADISVRVNTSTLSYISFNGLNSYAMQIFNTTSNLYSIGNAGYIILYPNLNINQMYSYAVPYPSANPNKMFLSNAGRMFFTNFNVAKDLQRLIIPPYFDLNQTKAAGTGTFTANVIITDANGVQVSNSVQYTVNPELGAVSITGATYTSGQSGPVTPDAAWSGGTGPYSIKWNATYNFPFSYSYLGANAVNETDPTTSTTYLNLTDKNSSDKMWLCTVAANAQNGDASASVIQPTLGEYVFSTDDQDGNGAIYISTNTPNCFAQGQNSDGYPNGMAGTLVGWSGPTNYTILNDTFNSNPDGWPADEVAKIKYALTSTSNVVITVGCSDGNCDDTLEAQGSGSTGYIIVPGSCTMVANGIQDADGYETAASYVCMNQPSGAYTVNILSVGEDLNIVILKLGPNIANYTFSGVSQPSNSLAIGANQQYLVKVGAKVTDNLSEQISNSTQIVPTLYSTLWSALHGTINGGQTQTLSASANGGTTPYTYNILVYNAIGARVANQLGSSNSLAFQVSQSFGSGGFSANVYITDNGVPQQEASNTLAFTVNGTTTTSSSTTTVPQSGGGGGNSGGLVPSTTTATSTTAGTTASTVGQTVITSTASATTSSATSTITATTTVEPQNSTSQSQQSGKEGGIAGEIGYALAHDWGLGLSAAAILALAAGLWYYLARRHR